MKTPSLKKTAVAAAVAGTLVAAGIPAAEADVVNLSWKGAFTMLNPTGAPVANSPGDYANGFYGVTGTASGPATTYGWKGSRTPITGTMSFDTSTGAGVAMFNAFLFFGNGNHEYFGLDIYPYLPNSRFTIQTIDTAGTLVGSMVFIWGYGAHEMSLVMDAGQMFAALPDMIAGGPTTTVSGSYTVLSPGPTISTAIARASTRNTSAGCDGLTLTTQVNAYTINTNSANVATCTTGMSDDGIAGDPMTSAAFSAFNANFDILEVHFDSYVTPPGVPIPPALWLFGSGLLGLIGLARRKRQINNM